MQESMHFVARVRCRRKESSRSLSHLLMSFLFKRFRRFAMKLPIHFVITGLETAGI